jgi:DNA-binding transcriptional regulator GbsR (MarR family)
MSPKKTTRSEAAREAELLAADAIGDVIEHWGFRKALGRVWSVLYLEAEPLPAAEISERLSMSAGAVSMSLTELQRWGVIRRVWRPGERREFYDAETDFWKMISKVVNERERFLASSVRDRLDRAAALLERAPSSTATATALDRVRRLSSFANVAQAVLDTFISSRLADFSEFGNLLSLSRAVRRRRGA